MARICNENEPAANCRQLRCDSITEARLEAPVMRARAEARDAFHGFGCWTMGYGGHGTHLGPEGLRDVDGKTACSELSREDRLETRGIGPAIRLWLFIGQLRGVNKMGPMVEESRDRSRHRPWFRPPKPLKSTTFRRYGDSDACPRRVDCAISCRDYGSPH